MDSSGPLQVHLRLIEVAHLRLVAGKVELNLSNRLDAALQHASGSRRAEDRPEVVDKVTIPTPTSAAISWMPGDDSSSS